MPTDQTPPDPKPYDRQAHQEWQQAQAARKTGQPVPHSPSIEPPVHPIPPPDATKPDSGAAGQSQPPPSRTHTPEPHRQAHKLALAIFNNYLLVKLPDPIRFLDGLAQRQERLHHDAHDSARTLHLTNRLSAALSSLFHYLQSTPQGNLFLITKR